VLVEDWRIGYNPVRPHGSSATLIPTGYATAWSATTPHAHDEWTNNPGAGHGW
jgi:transposase InsO family protein